MNHYLINKTGNKSNNLQLMKFIAALLVICSHAYPIVQGSMENEPLYRITAGQLSMGGFAVAVFFFSAGFFIAGSVEKKKTARKYFASRCKRIFPLLWIVVTASVLGGALLTSLNKQAYFLNKNTWMYFLNGFLIPVHNLPGVFENNPYLPTVNGALWTLPLEFICYIGCFFCYKLGLLKKTKYLFYCIPATALTVALLFLEKQYPSFLQIYRPCMMFLIGMGYWIYKDKIALHFRLLFPGSILLIVCFLLHIANVGMFLIFPYLCMLVWYAKGQVSDKIAILGDWSYGIYLCGFPIQQTFAFIFGKNLLFSSHMIFALIVSVILGFFLYKIDKIF